MSVLVTIPGPSASSSKMQRKGWKCWAKVLSSVADPANNGYAYDGEFLSVGSNVELEVGDVILHVDQSSSATIGVVMVNKAGKGILKWIGEGASSDGRRWCGPLGRPARKLLSMDQPERIKHVAEIIVKNPPPEGRPIDVQTYWESVAYPPIDDDGEPVENHLADVSTDDLLAELSRRGVTVQS